MIVTKNFKRIVGSNGQFIGESAIASAKENGVQVLRDVRNNIVCIAPTMDLVCYYNYLVLLNSEYSNWKNYGYLDAGLVPYLMAPSFMQEILVANMGPLIDGKKVDKYALKPVSFLCNGYVGGSKDIWIKKTDLAEIMGCPVEQASMTRFLESKIFGGR